MWVALNELGRHPGEREDIADVIVRRMDEVERRKGGSVPHANGPIAFMWSM